MIKRTLIKGLALSALALSCFADRADANFQYVPDNDSAAQPSAPYSSSAPTPIARQALPTAPDVPPLSYPATHSSGKASKGGGAVINGFGTQVPLVIALRQIVPSSYQFGFGNGVNLGTLVNWKGGKPWRDVMNSVLRPLGLTASERNMVIYINQE